MWRLLLVLTLLVPGPALALSCVPHNPGRALNAHFERREAVEVVYGTLVPPDHVPERRGTETMTVQYRVEGMRLSGSEPDQPWDALVEVRTTCIASWCGRLPTRAERGIFLITDPGDGRYRLTIGACGGGIYPSPRREIWAPNLTALRACLMRRSCGPAELIVLDRKMPGTLPNEITRYIWE